MSPYQKVLLVEGRDDREVIYQFCNYHGIDNQNLFKVEAKDGVEELLDDLKVRIRTEMKVLAAVIDADTDLNARWEQLCAILTMNGYDIPQQPKENGTIIAAPNSTRPQLGIWLMPDNQSTGMLEDFLLRLTQSADPLVNRAQQVVESIPESERLFGETKQSKAIIHTWLAWQSEPGTPLGLALRKQYLDPTQHPAPEFKSWLEQLFLSNESLE